MKNTLKIRNKLLIALTVLTSFAMVGGVLAMVEKDKFLPVSAATQTKTLDEVSFVMDSGAAVRKDTPTGIRFRSLLSVEDYNALEANTSTYTRITYGMLIAPTDYLMTYGALNEENVFGDDAIYGWMKGSEKVGGDVTIINVSRNEMTDYTDDDGNVWKNFMGVMHDVKGTNYHRDFIGVGYIEAVDKEGNVTYKFAAENDNSRSIAYVAQKALLAGEADSNSALQGFVEYAHLSVIVSKTVNATAARPIDYSTGLGNFTASADNMYVYLDKDAIADYGAGYDYMELTVHSSNAAEFRIFTVNSNDQENAAYVYNTLTGAQTHKIPLHEAALHDFSKHDLRLFAAGAGQNITIDAITFGNEENVEVVPEADLAKTILSSEGNFWNYFHFGAWGTNTWDGNSVNVTTSNFQIQKAFIDDALAQGYTHARISVSAASSDVKSVVLTTDGSLGWNYYWKQYNGNSADVRIDLSAYAGKDYSTLTLEFRNSVGAGTSSSVTVTDIEFFKSEETTAWTKTNTSIYAAYENGKLVIDMVGAGGNPAGVSTTAEWWQHYAGACANSAIRVHTEYLYRNGNSRAPLWGKNGNAVDTLYGGSEDSGSRWLNDQNANGDTFFFTADTESVYTVEFVDWISNRNEWSGTSFEQSSSDMLLVDGLEGQYLWLSNYADYKAAGYTHITIDASYESGGLWAGNDVWGGEGYMHSLASGEPKSLELSKMDKFCLYFSAATPEAEICYEFEIIETPTITLPTGQGYAVNAITESYKEGKAYSFEVAVADGYDATAMRVCVNGETLYLVDGVYTIARPFGSQVVTVSGVKAEEYSVILPTSNAYTGAQMITVNKGGNAVFTIAPVQSGAILTVKAGDTVLTGVDGVYTVENVTKNVVLSVDVSMTEEEPAVPTLGEIMMSSEGNFWNYFHFGAWGTNTWDGNSVNVTTSNFQIQKAFIDDALAQGYTHAKISVSSASSDIASVVLLTDGSLGWNYYWKQYSGNSADVRIDLNTYVGKDYSTLTIEFRNSAGAGTNSSVTMTGIEFYKSEETTAWTKTNNSVYAAYEDGKLIVDTVSAGGDSGIGTTTEWWKRYAVCYTGAQPAILMYANYLYAGSNSRAALWGKNGSPINTIHGNGLSAAWGWNNDLSYTDGDTFFLSMDKEAVVEFEILEWHSTHNGWSGTAIEKVDNDTIKVTALNGQKLFLTTYEDYLAAGYTEVTITATYASGDFWVGNDVWSGEGAYMHSLVSGASKTLDLSKMEQLCLFFNAAMSDVEITYVFGGMMDYDIANYAIVVPDENNDTISYAAAELQYFVNEMVGVKLPIKQQSQASAYEGKQIVIGSTQLTDVPQSASAYALANIGGDLHIGGYDDRGILYGVYELLDLFGVKFLTADYTHIPNVDTLSVEIDAIAEAPAFAYAAYYTGATHDVTALDNVKYTSRMRFVHQFTGEAMDNIYYAPNAGNDELVYGANGTLATIEATQIRMDWFANGQISSSHNAVEYAALGVYAMREQIADWSEMIEFGYATDTWYWGNDSTPATLESTWGGYDEKNIKPLISGEIAYESIRLDTAYLQANYSSLIYADGSDLCYSSGVLKDTGNTVTALSLVKAGMDYAMTNYGENNTYFMLGYTDQEERCTCSVCGRETSKSTIGGTVTVYEYNKTYYYYKFMQAVANEMLTKHPDKKIVMFAYSSSSGDVPSTGSLDGNWLTGYDPYIEPVSVDTIGKLPANVYVQWAPIWLDEAYALNDTTSAGARTEVAAQLAAWSGYVQNNQFMHWGYDNYYFLYADTLSVLAENVECAKQYGFTSYMVQASNSESKLPEMAMKSYVLSKAVWYDGTVTDALVEEWRDEFIKYYYGEAAYSYVVQYYTELNAAYASTFTEGYKTNDWSLGYTGDWPMVSADTLKTLIGYLNNAVSAVGEDSVYADHIELLKLSPRYMYVDTYGDDTSGVAGTEAALKADMLAAGVKFVGENVTVESKLG